MIAIVSNSRGGRAGPANARVTPAETSFKGATARNHAAKLSGRTLRPGRTVLNWPATVISRSEQTAWP